VFYDVSRRCFFLIAVGNVESEMRQARAVWRELLVELPRMRTQTYMDLLRIAVCTQCIGFELVLYH
jgi:hypothetical protein